MAKTNSSSNSNNLQEIEQLRNQVEWLDQERRKANRKLAEMEQRLPCKSAKFPAVNSASKSWKNNWRPCTAQIARIPQIDVKLGQFKDEMVQMIDQYDQRRVKAGEEQERVRRVEHESTARELGDIRKELPAIGRLAQDMELRQAEEARLANLIGQQKNQISSVSNQLEETQRALPLSKKKKNKAAAPLPTCKTASSTSTNAGHPLTTGWTCWPAKWPAWKPPSIIPRRQDKVRRQLKSWMEQVQVGEHERNKKLEKWRYTLEEQAQTLDQFRKEWITFSDQYKEAKMAVDTLGGWQRQIEQQQQEATEIMRIDSHRMQSRWDNFTQENEKRWRNLEMEMEQRWQSIARQEKQIQEHIQELEGYLKELEQEKETFAAGAKCPIRRHQENPAHLAGRGRKSGGPRPQPPPRRPAGPRPRRIERET
jgi:chromosome segregation ATPase